MKRTKTTRTGAPAAAEPEPTPMMRDQLLISDLETVRIIADPTRLRILELLVLEPQPVKRLAATLDLPQTKLYYHINLLEERGLIQVVSTRVVSGIIEKQYGAVARSYRLDEALLALNTPGRDDTVELMLAGLLDGVKQDVRQGLTTGQIELSDSAPVEHRITIGRAPLRLTPERAEELHRRLGDLIKEFCPDPNDLGTPSPGTRLYQMFVALFPSYDGSEQAAPGDEPPQV